MRKHVGTGLRQIATLLVHAAERVDPQPMPPPLRFYGGMATCTDGTIKWNRTA